MKLFGEIRRLVYFGYGSDSPSIQFKFGSGQGKTLRELNRPEMNPLEP